jgi:hypothetical protein
MKIRKLVCSKETKLIEELYEDTNTFQEHQTVDNHSVTSLPASPYQPHNYDHHKCNRQYAYPYSRFKNSTHYFTAAQ